MSDHALQQLVDALVAKGSQWLPDGARSADSNQTRNWIEALLETASQLGYHMEPDTGDSGSAESGPIGSRVMSDWLGRLQSVGDFTLPDLLSVWKATSDLPRSTSPEIQRLVAEMVLKKGEPLIAYDVLASARQSWPDDVSLQRLQALALARSGAVERAGRLLEALVESGASDGDTLGMLARTHKDRWQLATDEAARRRHLKSAGDLYTRGFEQAMASRQTADAIYTGINAATMAFLLGQKTQAEELAQQVHTLCLNHDPQHKDYWAQASVGEAYLILGQLEEASERYAAAARLGAGNYAELNSTRRNARILLVASDQRRDLFDALFEIPAVVVFVGHMIDRPDRVVPRFPSALQDTVRQVLRTELAQIGAGFGFSSAACGADTLFLEEMHDRGAETHVVLPLPPTDFERTSVTVDAAGDWEVRYRAALSRATRVIVASERRYSESPVVFEYANCIQTGLARLKAQTLGTELIPIAVWDGQIIHAPGGTASQIGAWKELGLDPHVIDLSLLLAEHLQVPVQKPSEETSSLDPLSEAGQTIRAILFADVVGFTNLRDEEIPTFVDQFMTDVADWIKDSPFRPQSKNSWGDALYFVFENVSQAGLCALALSEHMRETNWRAKGFRQELTLRIGLHAGPVYACTDPITLQDTFVGSHVSRAARIEPITPPGQVYASEAFAALVAAQQTRTFECDYVGMTTLAKKYGAFPTYHVRRGET